jgi:hypothetical protein
LGGTQSIFEKLGLYEGCPVGGADHLMAHAFLGDFESPRLAGPQKIAGNEISFLQWATEAYALTDGLVGHVDGTILHLWHGRSRKPASTPLAPGFARLG